MVSTCIIHVLVRVFALMGQGGGQSVKVVLEGEGETDRFLSNATKL